MINLLQIDSTHAAASSSGVSLFNLLTLGGWVMIPLMLLLVVTIFVFFERADHGRIRCRIELLVELNDTARRESAGKFAADWFVEGKLNRIAVKIKMYFLPLTVNTAGKAQD